MGNTNLLNRQETPLNIWIIDHYAQPEKYKPLIRQTLFARNLVKMGHIVRIFCASTVHNTDINLIADNSLYKEEIIDGIAYTYVRCHSYTKNNYKRILNMYEFAHNVKKVCAVFAKKEEKPDRVLSCSMTLQACRAGIKIGHRYHAKVVAQVTDMWPETIVALGKAGKHHPIVMLFRRIEKWIYVNADQLVFSLGGAYDYILEQGWQDVIPKSKVHYINNGIDLVQFDYNKENYTVDDLHLSNEGLFKVVYVGSIREANRISTVLDVAKLIKDKRIVFLLWGDGDQVDYIKRRIKEEKIANVFLKGVVEKKYIPFITSNADINLMHWNPSPISRFGISLNKMFDYLASGKPILADFHCPYNPAIESGGAVEAENSTAVEIAKAVEKMASMSMEELSKLGFNARNMAKEYDFKLLTKKLLDIME